LHDLFLAATAQALSAVSGAAPNKRDSVAIVSAMDLRRFLPDARRSDFGLLIGQYIVTARRPDEASLPELTARIAGQSRRAKAAPGTELFDPSLTILRWSASARAKATLFSRGAPLVAGLSNVNLTGSWIEESDILEYRRIGPTGPAVPLVLMITTLRGRIFVDVTYRRAAFKAAAAARVVDDLIGRLPFS
jgi:hypothetical protein